MLFPAVVMNSPNSKARLKWERSIIDRPRPLFGVLLESSLFCYHPYGKFTYDFTDVKFFTYVELEHFTYENFICEIHFTCEIFTYEELDNNLITKII